MNEWIRVGEGLFSWVLQTSWQAGVLAVLILLAQTVFRRQLSPSWRYALWFLLVARLLLPNTPASSWSIFNVAGLPRANSASVAPNETLAPPALQPASAMGDDSQATDPARSAGAKSVDTLSGGPKKPVAGDRFTIPVLRLAFLSWILGACFFAVRLVWSNLSFLHAIDHRDKVTSEPVLLLLRRCQEILGVTQSVDLTETRAVRSPSVYGLRTKRLLLPTGTLQNFSMEQLRCIFLHELAHIKRRDLEVNWLVSLLLVVHWFNPLLWLAFYRMRYDREIACDALVLTRVGDSFAQPYGETIIKVVENLLPGSRPPGVLALSEDSNQLKERIRLIARFRIWPRWSTLAVILTTGITAVGLTNASRDQPASAPAQESVITSTSTNQEAAQLPKGIHVRLVDIQGSPVTNADVEGQLSSWRATTDTQGRFSWVGVDGPKKFLIRKSGFTTLVTGLLSPNETETVLRLQTIPVIGGKVMDADTRQPISAFRVYHVRMLQGSLMPSLYTHEVVTGNSGAFKFSFDYSLWPDSVFYIAAEGYRPVLSRPLSAGDHGKELEFELTKAPPIGGKVLTPQGIPAAKAEIRLWCGELNLPQIPNSNLARADESGDFSVPVVLDGKLLVSHDSGYAEIPWNDFLSNRNIQLVEWGQVEGKWPTPLPENRKVSLERIRWSGPDNMYSSPPPWRISSVEINQDGSFKFEKNVPPGEYMLTQGNSLKVESRGGFMMPVLISKRRCVQVKAGRTTVVEVPAGRTLVGKVVAEDELSLAAIHLPIVSLSKKLTGPDFDNPTVDPAVSETEWLTRWTDFRERVLKYWLSEEGKSRRREERVIEIATEPDGTFRFDNVPVGTYELQVNAKRWGGKSGPEIQREISISASREEIPVDLGVFKL